MKSNSSLFSDTFNGYNKRERCLSLNVITGVPLVVTSFFIASIFTFFLLYYPNPLTLIPNHPSPSLSPPHSEIPHPPIKHQQHASTNYVSPPTLKPQNEQKTCNLTKGQWVRAQREPSYYTNYSCTSIPESKNCFMQGRKDSDFLNWKWKPDDCELESFNPKIFLQIVRDKNMAFIGDSVSRNHMDSLVCLLSQEEKPVEVYKDSEDRFRKWYFPKSNFTIMSLWCRFLIEAQERMINGTGSSEFDLYLDQLDQDWAQPFPTLHYTIINSAHWFFRVMYLHQAQSLVGCVYCNQPNTTSYNVDFPLRMAFRSTFNFINTNSNKDQLVMVRTFAPAHFEGGVWNKGGYCNRTGPAREEEIDWERFDWEVRRVQMEEFERGKKEGEKKGVKYEILDVTKAMTLRPDGHPGEFWGNKWMRGYNDCTHWCMPGPVDFWSELMFAIIRRHASSSSSSNI